MCRGVWAPAVFPTSVARRHQVQSDLATDFTALTICIGHTNGGLHGQVATGVSMCAAACACTPYLKFL